MSKLLVCLIILTSLTACHAGFGVGGERRHGANDSLESAIAQADVGNYK